MSRFAWMLAVICVLSGASRIVSTYRELSVTTDEPYHLTCGLEWWTTHTRAEVEQPPLAQAAVAAGPLLEGARVDPSQGVRPLFVGPNAWRFIVAMRAGVLPFFCLAALVVFWSARRLFGDAAGLAATVLFTLTPPVLAHAGLATTDMALAAMVTAAFAAMVWWWERPGMVRAAAMGAATGLAVLAKFTALAYLPAAAAFALAFTAAVRPPRWKEVRRGAGERWASLAAAVVLGALVIWAGYRFAPGAPELWAGLTAAAKHNRAGHAAFLLGNQRTTGWWYFFPVVLAVKTPVPLLLLSAAGVYEAWRLRRRGGLLPVAFCLGVLAPAMAGSINIGLRHVLPVYAGIAVMGGAAVAGGVQRWRSAWAWTVPAILLAWLALSGARAHPDYVSYFNELAGKRPDRIVVDSDLDWRQDLVLVARRLREVKAPAVWLDLDPYGYPNRDVYEPLYGLPPIQPETAVPQPGWHVVGLTALRMAGVRPGAWYERMTPEERIGGMLLFRVP